MVTRFPVLAGLILFTNPVFAASVTYEYVLGYQREAFAGAEVHERITYYDPDEDENVTREVTRYDYRDNGYADLRGEDNVWGFAGPLSGLAPGAHVTLSMTIDLDTYGGGGSYRLTGCRFDTFDCLGFDYWDPAGPGGYLDYGSIFGAEGVLNGFSATDFDIEGRLAAGSEIEARFVYVEGADMFPRTDTLRGSYKDYLAYFSFVSVSRPACSAFDGRSTYDGVAPVCREDRPQLISTPLPASLLLLAGGLGGIGLLGRRRPAA